LQKAVDMLDGQVRTANAVGVRQAHVWRWLNTTRAGVPAEYVIPISAATDYQVTPHELRPDLYPHPDDGLPEALRQVPAAA
jgi:DNA-binding transcriptional regulator YdaS (Cro superfamily)